MHLGMSKVSSITDLVNLWPTRAALADDIGVVSPEVKVTASQVHKWAEKNSIRAIYHKAVLLAAQSRGFPVTAELIVALHAPRKDAA